MARLCLCVLFAAVTVTLGNPVPDFGLLNKISGSDQVAKASDQTSVLLGTVDDRLNTSLTSSYRKLRDTLAQLTPLANFVVSIDATVIGPLLALTNDGSGVDVGGKFAPVLAGVISTRDYMERTLPIELDRLEALISVHVPNRLKDAFGCVRGGLDHLGDNLNALRDALLGAIAHVGSADVPAVALSQYRIPGIVFDVARSVSDVKVCIPSIVETIHSTIENLKTADDYILSFRALLSKLG